MWVNHATVKSLQRPLSPPAKRSKRLTSVRRNMADVFETMKLCLLWILLTAVTLQLLGLMTVCLRDHKRPLVT